MNNVKDKKFIIVNEEMYSQMMAMGFQFICETTINNNQLFTFAWDSEIAKKINFDDNKIILTDKMYF